MDVFKILLLFLIIICSAFALKSYSGYQVIRTSPLDVRTLSLLQPLLSRPEFDFWSKPRMGHEVNVMTSSQHIYELRDIFTTFGLQHSVLIADVQENIVKERAEIERLRKQPDVRTNRAPTLDRYLEFDEIQAYLDDIVTTFPSIASIINIGSSYEGRPLRVLKLSNGPGKTAIWFDAAIHAREWAAPPVTLFAINELTENLSENQAMLDANDFYFLPVSNPDGYIYTWQTDRFWRKTRSVNNASICMGADPNRNFDYNWGGGGIPIECDLMYPGSAPFSESESKAIADYLLSNPRITFYVTVHSYGSYILYPYGDTTELPPDFDELYRVSREAAVAIESVRGTRYRVGTTAEILYLAYGQGDDWVYDVAGIPFSYTIELPGGGTGGFDLPPSDIIPMVTETWEAIKVFAANTPATRRNIIKQ